MKKARFLISVLAVICIMIVSVGLVACEPTEVIPPEPPAPPIVVEGPEAGVYYDVDGTDQYIILNAGNMFVLSVGEKPRAGVYTLENGALTLTFVKTSETEETASGTLTAEEITLTYGDKTIVFRKTASYTVRFEVNGGSAVNSQKVAIGKQAIEPEAPEKEGSLFLGWYADAAFTERYDFTKKVTSDTTIYAKWAERVVGQEEYVIGYDLGYTGEKIAETTTFGGKLHNVAEPAPRSGYKFGGWWISMYDDGTRLSYKYTDGMNFREDTTLYAMWIPESTGNKLASPVVNVTDKGASWDNIAGASTYRVKVEGPVGFTTIETSSPTPMYSIDFANSPAGDYTITVVAASTATDGDSEPTVRHYKNKALARVSKFNVIDNSVLVFTGVENAKEYYIRVNCGDELHNHSAHALGNVTSFNFVNCPMGEDGISFVVTAKANGYASSDSRAFVYNRVLDKIEELKYDEATQVVSWDNVQDAAGYIVSVRSGETELIVDDIGKVNRFSLKEFAPTNGKLVVSVYPVAKGYNSPEATTLTCNKTVLATPQNIRIIGNILYWDEVADAAKYEITIGDKTITAEKPEEGELRYDLTEALGETPAEDYVLKIRAIDASGNGSLWSDAIDVRYNKMYATLAYSRNEVSWRHVIGAVRYEVRVNNGEVISVTDGKNSAKVTLTAENNEIAVRFISADAEGKETASDWATIEVEAYEIIFETNGGETIGSMFAALGDKITLPEAAKQHYTFMGWYNSPKGPIGNGMRYEEGYLTEAAPQVIFAFYEANRYGVELKVDNGSIEETQVEVAYDSDYTLPVPTTTDGTVQFEGWFSGINGTGTQYTDGDGNSLQPFTDGGTVVLYAFWRTLILDFELTKVGTRQAYSVTKGSRIRQVTEVKIPKEYRGIPVLMIGPGAFKDCTLLKRIEFPNTIELISSANPFSGTLALEEIIVTKEDGVTNPRYWSADGVLVDNGRADEQTSVRVATLSHVPAAKTGSYRIPDEITAIGYKVFAASKITEIIIPTAITNIGEEAFYNCPDLSKVTFEKPNEGEEVKELVIERKAFSTCKKLTEFIVPARVKTLNLGRYEITKDSSKNVYNISLTKGDGITDIFYACTGLNSIEVDPDNQNYKSVDGIIYSKDGTELIYCPEGKTNEAKAVPIEAGTVKIADGAFIDCDKFNVLDIPNTIQTIGECAFYGCSYLKKVTFKAGATGAIMPTKIGRFAFRYSVDIAEVIFEEGSQVTEIGEGAFYQCYDLTSFTIPATMKKVGKQAFRECTKLASVEFAEAENPNEVEFEEDVFYGCIKLTTFRLPAHVKKLPGVFTGCTSLQNIEVDPANPYYTDVDGVLYNREKTELVFWPMGRGGVVKLEPTVTTLANGIFQSNVNITGITIGANIEKIGEYAFRDCKNLAEVIFEPSEKPLELGSYVFADCDSIVKLEIPGRVKELKNYAISSITALESLTLNEGISAIGDYGIHNNYRLVKLVIPSTVTKIGTYGVGGNTSLKEITFSPNSQLKEIGDNAFFGHRVVNFVIPKSVTKIGYRAFSTSTTISGSLLESVTFEEGSLLEEIGPYAFNYCTKLESIVIPKNVKKIEASAFYGCRKLQTLSFEKGGTEDLIIGSFSKYKTSATSSFTYNYGYTFYDCRELKSIEIPARAVEIGEAAFKNCIALEKVTFEKDSRLRSIGESAFEDCKVLAAIELPNSIGNNTPFNNPDYPSEASKAYDRPAIGARAFFDCESMTSFTIADGENDAPITIGEKAFYNCVKLVEFKIPARLGEYTSKDGETWTGIISPHEVFYKCSALKALDVSGEVPKFESAQKTLNGILYNGDFTEVVFCPRGFEGVVNISGKVTKICDAAFKDCVNITSFVFEASADESPLVIGEEAFYNCDGLGRKLNAENEWVELENGYDFVLPDRTIEIGDGAVRHTSYITSFTIPKNLASFTTAIIEDCENLVNINVAADHPTYKSIDGILYEKDADGKAKKLLFVPYPKKLDTYTVEQGVIEISDNAFKKNRNVKKVILPAGLERIGAYAFENCTSLESINIPNTVMLIDDRAFNYCSSLKTIDFEAGGTSPLAIGSNKYVSLSYVFNRCSSLERIELPERTTVIEDYAFGYAGMRELVIPASITTIADFAFNQCANLVSVEWAQGSKITKIGKYAFANCISLKEFVFPETLIETDTAILQNCSALEKVTINSALETLGKNAFEGTKSLKTIIFPKDSKLTVIPQYAFKNSGLVEIEIPYSIEKIDSTGSSNSPFVNCAQLEKVTFAYGPNGEASALEAIGNYTFAKTGLKSIIVPASVNKLGTYVFQGCENLEEVIFEEGSAFETFDRYVFSGCISLKTITIPDSVTTIEQNAFSESGLTEITIPSQVKSIKANVFKDCANLAKVDWQSTVTSIPNYTFQNCVSLKSIDLPKATAYGSTCFSGSGIETFTIASTVKTLGASLFKNCESLKEIIFENAPTTLPANFLEGCVLIKEVIIPDSVTSLSNGYIFKNCTSLEKVTFPNNEKITRLGTSMFEGCSSLKEIEIPKTVTAINGSFLFKSGITKVVVPDTVTSIGSKAFQECPNLTEVVLPNNEKFVKIDIYTFQDSVKLSKVNIPDSVTSIGNYAFQNTAITSINIPDAVTTIGLSAFKQTLLEEVVVPSSVEELKDETFAECPNLVEVLMSSGLTEIGDEVFKNCPKLVSAEIPDTVTSIGDNPFFGCTAMQGIGVSALNTDYIIEDGVLYTGHSAYDGARELVSYPAGKVGSFNIPTNVAEVAPYAFAGATVPELVVPANVTIASHAFESSIINKITFGNDTTFGAYMLKESTVSEVVLPDDMLEFPSYMLQDCLNLKTITIPSSVTNFKSNAFTGCGITNIVIPKNVTSIGSSAFVDCASLVSVEFETGGTQELSIGSSSFKNCTALKSIKIPYRVRSARSSQMLVSNAFEGCTALETVVFEKNPEVGALEGTLVIGSSIFKNCTSLKRVEFPEELKRPNSKSIIGTSVFEGCTSLEEVVFNVAEDAGEFAIPASTFLKCTSLKKFECHEKVVEIGKSAFEGSGLEEFVIPETVKTLSGYSIFKDCVNLKKVVSYSPYTYIPNQTFQGCISLVEFRIPRTIKYLNANAFDGCTAMKKIFIPSNVTSVGKEVFNGWTKDQIIYVEAASQPSGWNAGWADGCEAEIVWGASESDVYPNA